MRYESDAAACRQLDEPGERDGHVISWQQRDVNLPPDPVLKLTAVAPDRAFGRFLAKLELDTDSWSAKINSQPQEAR
jgi:hypothetical protein